MRKLFAFVLAAALVMSMSTVSVFAATEKFDISYDALREVNDAVGKEGADAQSGESYTAIGDWHWTGGAPGQGTNDYLLPFGPFTASESEDNIVMMNYNNYMRISKNIDLGKYTKMTISYSIDASADVTGNEIGFFSKATKFGQAADSSKTSENLVVSAPITKYDGQNWNVPNTVEIDLTDVDYSGELYISYYMEIPNGVCVTAIEFELAEGDTGNTGNANTADGFSGIFMIAAAAMAVTVVMKKRAY